MAKKKTVEELLLEGFGGSRTEKYFKDFTDEEYIGYVVGVTNLPFSLPPANPTGFLHAARKLFKEGKL